MEQSKACTKCGQIKPLTEYHKHKNSADGHSQRCKPCRIEDAAAYREANRDKVNESNRNYHNRNKEVRNAGRSKRYKDNPEYYINYRRNYYQATRELQIEHSRNWRAENPELVRQQWALRRARKTNAPSEPYTAELILEIYGTDCHICNEPIDLEAPRSSNKEGFHRGLHLDHVVPLSKGGTDLIENIRPAHAICNIRKWIY